MHFGNAVLFSAAMALGSASVAFATVRCVDEVSPAAFLYQDLLTSDARTQEDWITAADEETLENELIEGLRRAAQAPIVPGAEGLELDALSLQIIDALGRVGQVHMREFLMTLVDARDRANPQNFRFGTSTRAHFRDAIAAIGAHSSVPEVQQREPEAEPEAVDSSYDDNYPFVVGEPSDDEWHALDLGNESKAKPDELVAAFDAIDEYTRPDKKLAAKWTWLNTRVVPYLQEYPEEEKIAMVRAFLQRGDLDSAMFVLHAVQCDLDSLDSGEVDDLVARARNRWDRLVQGNDILGALRRRIERSEGRLMAAELTLIAARPQITQRPGLERGDWTVTARALGALRSSSTDDDLADDIGELRIAVETAQERIEESR